MKAFTIDAESNITVFPSRKAAEANLPPTGALVFTTEAGLQGYLEKFPVAAAVEIWNGLTGVTPVTKFKDRATAVSRIWKAIQTLGQAEPVAAPEPAQESAAAIEIAEPEALVPATTEAAPDTPFAPQTPDVAPEAAPAKVKAARAKKEPKPASEPGTPREAARPPRLSRC